MHIWCLLHRSIAHWHIVHHTASQEAMMRMWKRARERLREKFPPNSCVTCSKWNWNECNVCIKHHWDMCLLHDDEQHRVLNQCRLFYLLLFSGLVIVMCVCVACERTMPTNTFTCFLSIIFRSIFGNVSALTYWWFWNQHCAFVFELYTFCSFAIGNKKR